MARFIDVHSGMTGITEEQLRMEHEKDTQVQGDDQKVRFLKAWADPKAGKVFCLSEGPNREAVRRVHEQAGHPADEIYEITHEVE